jgi:hypothetical protein
MLYVKEFKSRQEVQDFLQGVVVGGRPVDPYVGVNVRNLNLVFTTPSVTITFPDTVVWESARLNTIVSYINGPIIDGGTGEATSGIRSYGYGQPEKTAMIALTKDGDVLASGTAIAALGLVAATVGATKVTKTNYLELEHNAVSNVFFLVYDK